MTTATVTNGLGLRNGDMELTSLQGKFAHARTAMQAAMVERDEEIDLVLVSLLCRECCLFIGEPGVGKSFLLRNLLGWVKGAKEFHYLLTKYTDPAEIYGMFSLREITDNDNFVRKTTGKLPEAELVLLDEIWKASSAILNTFLEILNERIFRNGSETVRVPLRTAVAASNEWPDCQEHGKEQAAIFDRFLIRKEVRPVSRHRGRKELLQRSIKGDDCKPKFEKTIDLQELDQAYAEAQALPISEASQKILWEILTELAKEGVLPGDRRVMKAQSVARAQAYLEGAGQVEPPHLEVLKHVLWITPQEQPKKAAQVICKLANPIGMEISDKLAMMADVVEKSKPVEATTKLQSIRTALEQLPADPRRDKAINTCNAFIREVYDLVVGARAEK